MQSHLLWFLLKLETFWKKCFKEIFIKGHLRKNYYNTLGLMRVWRIVVRVYKISQNFNFVKYFLPYLDKRQFSPSDWMLFDNEQSKSVRTSKVGWNVLWGRYRLQRIHWKGWIQGVIQKTVIFNKLRRPKLFHRLDW